MNKNLAVQAKDFGFFQWMRVRARQEGAKPLRLVPNDSLKCPSRDIEKCEEHLDHDRLVLNFMGLYGVTSPLPEAMLSGIHSQSEDARSWKGLLELFNHRLYTLYYEAWQKRQPMLRWEAGDRSWTTKQNCRWQRVSLAMLRHWFAIRFGQSVEARDFCPREVENPASQVLGKSCLDGNHFLGRRCQSWLDGLEIICRDMPLEKVLFHKSEAGRLLRAKWKKQLEALLPCPLTVTLRLESVMPGHADRPSEEKLGMGCWLAGKALQPLIFTAVL